MSNTADKIMSWEAGAAAARAWQAEGKKIVFTNGCFDIVHLGHIDYLEKARNLGHKMVLGLNTDASVSKLKGPLRPVVNEYARARLMAALEFVDAVILFGEPTPLELIQTICPDILVKGDDYTPQNIVGADFVVERGGEVLTVPLVQGYSTSLLIEKIKKGY
ncbi:D-glycero-beta-D-manno-heptose 1-phosphate adenylyltransferase [Runella rosea]|jgi:rfaE bifunctional protein nucleotidyltransferase chain/domain|uniref:D-glycero-beta-D-manno-heptose 1-phosphate adenylyltransferase n=3 Tax=Runella TaxID=105 RepID=A0A344TJB1_9BACT|nr:MULTISPECIES: D-glycero-beta-D-manno-heptose 1-phosphate adenylyltransferase [Runella]AXE18732.1 D-glycero-beta-D-manno-heptose 1-phosphate adenylyltransferase [Runella rosea]MCP1385729.1 D-glycero-beta-D-manno-heptose 1-phosphate adenylyltransferase [Runella salmonicolor]NBB21409.1 D-glycero-beta-D-manno-heptose 1-phosphate adenylyltransferase [Runella sp. CRIBMP]RDB06962.1 D-glycero-beta-D-manno-heptose 1-phosphate adenylyltransferase [Runella aurantiaca]